MSERRAFLSVAALRERGLTPGMRETLLGTPDAARPNPHYRNPAAMRLYDPALVPTAETRTDFAAPQ